MANGTTSWTAPSIPLAGGVNLISVTATDAAGNASTDTIAVTVAQLSYSLAEGATGSFFDLDVLIANPNAQAAPVTVTFLKENGTTVTQQLTVAATSQLTIDVETIPGLEGTSVSTVVTSTATVLIWGSSATVEQPAPTNRGRSVVARFLIGSRSYKLHT